MITGVSPSFAARAENAVSSLSTSSYQARCVRSPARNASTLSHSAELIIPTPRSYACRMTWTDGALLARTSDQVEGVGDRVSADRLGRHYTTAGRGQIHVWAPDGRFLRTVGHVGSGPGEFANGRLGVFPSPNGHLYIIDNHHRLTVLDSAFRLVRTFNSRGSSSIFRAAVLDDGTLLDAERPLDPTRYFGITRLDHANDAGEPIPVRSFDVISAAERKVPRTSRARLIAYSGGDRFWAGPPQVAGRGYELQEWRVDGTLLRTVRRNASWYPSGIDESPSSSEKASAPPGEIEELFDLGDGLLFVAARVTNAAAGQRISSPRAIQYAGTVHLTFTGKSLMREPDKYWHLAGQCQLAKRYSRFQWVGSKAHCGAIAKLIFPAARKGCGPWNSNSFVSTYASNINRSCRGLYVLCLVTAHPIFAQIVARATTPDLQLIERFTVPDPKDGMAPLSIGAAFCGNSRIVVAYERPRAIALFDSTGRRVWYRERNQMIESLRCSGDTIALLARNDDWVFQLIAAATGREITHTSVETNIGDVVELIGWTGRIWALEILITSNGKSRTIVLVDTAGVRAGAVTLPDTAPTRTDAQRTQLMEVWNAMFKAVWPDTLRAQAIALDDGGRSAILGRIYAAPSGAYLMQRRDMEDKPLSRDANRIYDVVSETGLVTGRLRLPIGTAVTSFSGTHVLLLRRDPNETTPRTRVVLAELKSHE